MGTIVAPRGLKGELRVKPFTDDPKRFFDLKELYLLHPQKGALLYSIKSVRLAVPPHPPRAGEKAQQLLLVLEGLEDRTAAEKIVGCDLAVPLQEAKELASDSYFVHQIIGLVVEDGEGKPLGKVVDVFSTAAHDIYVVRRADREWYLPAVKEIIRQMDLAKGKMIIAPPPGLLEINE